MIKEFLEIKINNWYYNSNIDYNITGKFLNVLVENKEHLVVFWEEMNNHYKMIIPWFKEYTLSQLYNIWMQQACEVEKF